jgi:hypothetical protein
VRLCITQQLHVHRLVQDTRTGEVLQNFARHTFRQLDGGVGTEQLDVTDVTAADVAFVSDSANDVTNFNTIITAHFNAIQFHFASVTTLTTRTIFTATLRTVSTRTTVVAIVTVATAFETLVTVTEFTLRTHRRFWWQDQRTFALRHFQQRSSQRFDVQLFVSNRLNF